MCGHWTTGVVIEMLWCCVVIKLTKKKTQVHAVDIEQYFEKQF